MKSLMTFAFLALTAIALAGHAGEPTCQADAASCEPGTCCPKCGCHEGLVPICHSYCEYKKVYKYKYCCMCEDLCIPGKTPCCESCGDGCKCDGCAAAVGNEACGCESGHCDCTVRNVKKLVKIPYIVLEPVRKCNVEWTCPKCGCGCCQANGNNSVASADEVAPTVPSITPSQSLIPTAAQRLVSNATTNVQPVLFDAPIAPTRTADRITFPVR